MRAHATPLLVSAQGSAGQSCLALEKIPLQQGAAPKEKRGQRLLVADLWQVLLPDIAVVLAGLRGATSDRGSRFRSPTQNVIVASIAS